MNKFQFVISIALSSLFAWWVSPHMQVPATVISLAVIAALFAQAERQVSIYSAKLVLGPLIDGVVLLSGLVALIVLLPQVFSLAITFVARHFFETDLETLITPAAVLITLAAIVIGLLLLTYILRAMARASSTGRISFLGYRETVLFAAFMFCLAILEPRVWTAMTSLAALAGFVIPTLVREKLLAPSQGSLWLVMPNVSSSDQPYFDFARRLGRKLSDQRALNLVALPSAATSLGGEHLDLGFRLGKVKQLFPTLPIQLRDWRTVVPGGATALSLPRRELYPAAALLPQVISELVEPEDLIVVLSHQSDEQLDQVTRDTIAELPVQRSLHINLDEQADGITSNHVNGHVELTMSSAALKSESLHSVLNEHLPFIPFKLPTQKTTTPIGNRVRWFDVLSLSSIGWHYIQLAGVALLIGLDGYYHYLEIKTATNASTQNPGVITSTLLDFAIIAMMLATLVDWLRSTLSDKKTWIQQDLRVFNTRVAGYVFVLGLATLGLCYSLVSGLVTEYLISLAPVQTNNAEEIVAGKRDFGYLYSHIALLISLLLIWFTVPFQQTSQYKAQAQSMPALITLVNLNAKNISWWRVLFYAACGAGAVALTKLAIDIMILSGLSSFDMEDQFFMVVSPSLEFLARAFTIYIVIWLVLSAVRVRWAPYLMSAHRFALFCTIGFLIAEPIGGLLDRRLYDIYWLNPIAPDFYTWLAILGALTGGVLFLQKNGHTNIRILRNVLWPIVTAAIVFGLLQSDFVANLSDVDYISGSTQVIAPFFLILYIIPRLFLRFSSEKAPPMLSAGGWKVFHYLSALASCLFFVFLFMPLGDRGFYGYIDITDYLSIAPGRILMWSVLCAFLVTHLQRFVPTSENPEKVDISYTIDEDEMKKHSSYSEQIEPLREGDDPPTTIQS